MTLYLDKLRTYLVSDQRTGEGPALTYTLLHRVCVMVIEVKIYFINPVIEAPFSLLFTFVVIFILHRSSFFRSSNFCKIWLQKSPNANKTDVLFYNYTGNYNMHDKYIKAG